MRQLLAYIMCFCFSVTSGSAVAATFDVTWEPRLTPTWFAGTPYEVTSRYGISGPSVSQTVTLDATTRAVSFPLEWRLLLVPSGDVPTNDPSLIGNTDLQFIDGTLTIDEMAFSLGSELVLRTGENGRIAVTNAGRNYPVLRVIDMPDGSTLRVVFGTTGSFLPSFYERPDVGDGFRLPFELQLLTLPTPPADEPGEVIPLPAGAALLSSAILVLSVLRRRRRSRPSSTALKNAQHMSHQSNSGTALNM